MATYYENLQKNCSRCKKRDEREVSTIKDAGQPRNPWKDYRGKNIEQSRNPWKDYRYQDAAPKEEWRD